MTRTDPKDPPIELRRPFAAWQVAMDDGTHFYVDAGSGAIVARRTGWWRFYDLMWGFHIMDLQDPRGRAQPADHRLRDRRAGDVRLALVLLPMTIRRRRSGLSSD